MAVVSTMNIQAKEANQPIPTLGAHLESEFFVPLDESESSPSQSDLLAESPSGDDLEPEKSKWIPGGMTSASFLVSLVVHINVLVLLAAIWMMQKKDDQTIGLISTIAEQPGESDAMESLIVESLSQANMVNEQSTEPLVAEDQISPISTQLTTSTSLTLKISLGDGNNASGIQVGTAGFFGARTAGESFVFIVDNSGSMRGERFYRAVMELNSAINGLQKDQKFFVFFYNSVAVPMPVSGFRKLQPASDRRKKRAVQWIARQQTMGGTMPQEAVKMGLKMKPQVIFFLTDGIMPRDVRTTFQKYNTRSIRTIVHTIAFQSRVGEPILKGIAEDHEGRYRYVE